MRAKWIIVAISLFFLTLLFGCGGNSVTPDTNFRVDIYWAERGRAIQAPAAALSCKISLYPVVLLQTDHDLPADSHNPVLDMNTIQEQPSFQWIINRNAAPGAYLQHWVSPDKVPVRKWRVVVDFTSEANNAGSAVAYATMIFDLQEDGTGLDTISVNQVVKSLEVQNQQSIAVGEHKALAFIARDATGAAVAVTPGSVKWEVGSPAVGAPAARPILPEMLRFQDGQAYGLAVGSPTVRVTMDGMTSPWMTVVVYDPSPAITLLRCTVWKSNTNDQWIFFAGGVDGNLDIYRVKPDGSQFAKYTSIGKNIIRFDVSPDLNTIVFQEQGPNFWTDCHIMKINADGTGLTELVGARSGHPQFMNANTVLFEKSLAANNPSNLYTIPITGGEMTHIPNHTASEEQPSYQAAVGSRADRILYVEAYNGDAKLWTKSPDNTYYMAYTSEMHYGKVFGSPCYTLDGSQIIAPNSFRTNSGAALEIGIIDSTTGVMTYPFAENSFETVEGVSAGPNDKFSFIGKHDGIYSLFTCTPYGSDLTQIYPPEVPN